MIKHITYVLPPLSPSIRFHSLFVLMLSFRKIQPNKYKHWLIRLALSGLLLLLSLFGFNELISTYECQEGTVSALYVRQQRQLHLLCARVDICFCRKESTHENMKTK